MNRIIAACFCLVVVVVPAVLSVPWDIEPEAYGNEDDNRDALDLFHRLERKSFCSGWGDYCQPNAKVRFAQCCQGLRCVCNVWKNKSCTCKSPSIFGR